MIMMSGWDEYFKGLVLEAKKEVQMIKLGDKVKDEVSDIVGIATSRTEYMNGCVQYGVTAKVKKDSTDIITWNVDQEQLVVLLNKGKRKKKEAGGPTVRMSGYGRQGR